MLDGSVSVPTHGLSLDDRGELRAPELIAREIVGTWMQLMVLSRLTLADRGPIQD